MKSKRYIAKLKQGGIIVVEVNAPTKKRAIEEIQHYAMMYSQDGDVEIIKDKSGFDKPKVKYLEFEG